MYTDQPAESILDYKPKRAAIQQNEVVRIASMGYTGRGEYGSEPDGDLKR